MEIMGLTEKQFNSLEEYQTSKNLFTAESKLYILPIINKWKKTFKLLKKILYNRWANI